MHRRFSVIVGAAVWLAVAGAGCFSPQPDRSKFFVLAPSADVANSVAPAGLGAPSAATIIGLGPIKLPEYLDRDEVVTRVGPNRLELSNQDRWAEPLDNSFKQVIAQDLTQALSTHSITFYPWPGTTRVDCQVRIDVYRFETDAAATAHLIAHWQLLDGTGKLLYASDSNISEHAQAGETVAAALSRTVDGLARQIASAIQSLPRRRLPGQV